MFQFEANDAVVVEQRKALESALSTNPKTEKVLRQIIRKYILQARRDIMSGINFKHGDPRQTRQAVRTTVYRKVFGGNINILNARKAHGGGSYEPPRHPSHRGGNRRKRNAETQRMMSYGPLDRGFILRFINEGTTGRAIQFKVNDRRKVDKWNSHPNTGNRGSIVARHFFRSLGDRALGIMSGNVAMAIEQELEKIMTKQN